MTESEQLQLFSERAAPECGWPEWKDEEADMNSTLKIDGGRWRKVSRTVSGGHFVSSLRRSLHEAIALCEKHMREWLEDHVTGDWSLQWGRDDEAWMFENPLNDVVVNGPSYFEALVAAVQAAGKETT